MNLFFVLIAIGVIATVAYYAYKWWTGPHEPVAVLPEMGAFIVRSATLYGGYPTPFIYKKHGDSGDKYIMGMFSPSGSDGVAQVTYKELTVLLSQYPDKYDVLAPHSVSEIAASFAEAIRSFQAKALIALSQVDPTDLTMREKEITALTREPEAVIMDQISFMRDQLG